MRSRLERYVEEIKAAGLGLSAAVEEAFLSVERHRFFEGFYRWRSGEGAFERLEWVEFDPINPQAETLDLIYTNDVLVTHHEDGRPISSSSQPSLMAHMLDLLELRPGMRVLEVGAGTGYNAALIAELVGDQRLVVTIDLDDRIVEQARRGLGRAGYRDVTVLCRDGFVGAPEHAPYDRIVATVSCPDLSPRWIEQLAARGFMLVPLDHGVGQPLVRVWVESGTVRGRVVGWSGFMPARGQLQPLGLWTPGWMMPEGDGQVEERPGWEGYAIGEPVAPGQSMRSDELDFAFYLSLRDQRACQGVDGFGLSDLDRGWAFASRDTLRWSGDPGMLADLDQLHDEWEALGRPATSDYAMVFRPVTADQAPSTWTLTRTYHRQHLWLDSPS
jgi:protein-L-isoaspartate(D-aspartate) O-methyltransferase